MQTYELKASHMVGQEKVFDGSRTVKEPESISEVTLLLESGEMTIGDCVAGRDVRVQREIRGGTSADERRNKVVVNLGFVSFRHAVLCAKRAKGNLTPDEDIELQGIEKGII